MDDCPRLCTDCPMLPEGVQAVLTDAYIVTMTELRRYFFARDNPELAERFVGLTRIHTEVVTSARPNVDVGDTAAMLVQAGCKGGKELKELVRQCSGPRYTRLQRCVQRLRLFKLLGGRGSCGCMDHKRDLS
ncbi:MAG TPA: hypothetical protein VFZ58_05305 [Candidatus Saccharimonadales bacterium]